MATITYFVVQPFFRSDDGEMLPGEAFERQSASAAIYAAKIAAERGGAIAFSRTGDPATGDFADAVILFSSGVDVDAVAVAA